MIGDVNVVPQDLPPSYNEWPDQPIHAYRKTEKSTSSENCPLAITALSIAVIAGLVAFLYSKEYFA